MKKNQHSTVGRVRIIAGRWRGRKLPVLSQRGLRPTGDRVKETLFNWLMGDIAGTRCLDCFAGSGSLGLEALSRGADYVLFLEKSREVAQQLKLNLDRLNTQKGEVKQGDTLQYLCQYSPFMPFDVVFVDPPFHFGLVEKTLQVLQDNGYVKAGSLVYVESEKEALFLLSPRWQCEKEKITGQVGYGLYRFLG